MNLPGYGRSTPAGPSVEDCADRIAELLEALRLPRETDVLGNGLGGFIAQALAIRHSERFDRLVIVDSLATFPEPGKGPLRRLARAVQVDGMNAALDAAIQRMFPPAYIQAHPEVVEERKQGLRQIDPQVFAGLCLALTRVNFEPHLAGIRNPVLVIVGAQDATTTPALALKLAEGIPQARFVEIADSGHCPQIEQPELLVAQLEAFLPAP